MNATISQTRLAEMVNQLDYFGIVGVARYAERDAVLAARPNATCEDTGVSFKITQPRPGYAVPTDDFGAPCSVAPDYD
jgi:hypothetical protein